MNSISKEKDSSSIVKTDDKSREKLLQKRQSIVSYNFCMQSNIFEISIFGISIAPKWYGLMYALGFIICFQFMKKWSRLTIKELDTLLIYVFFWVVLGGRFGYILFYNPSFFINNPIDIFFIWQGWMSFHGWLLWVITAITLFSKKYRKSFFQISDPLAIIIPVALWLGRLGNFINQELLWYFPYYWPWAMIKEGVSYFPSPLLEMILEWIFLFALMLFSALKFWYFQQKDQYHRITSGYLSAIFLIWYGFMRLIAEQFRLPDSHIWYVFGTSWITLGMIYTTPLLLVWTFILIFFRNKQTR